MSTALLKGLPEAVKNGRRYADQGNYDAAGVVFVGINTKITQCAIVTSNTDTLRSLKDLTVELLPSLLPWPFLRASLLS